MKIRTVLLSCLAAVLVATTGSGNVALAEDAFKNCTGDPNGEDQVCSATHSGDLMLGGGPVPGIFTLQTLDKSQTAILTNIGSIAYRVLIEQGLRIEQRFVVKPGESVDIGPFDSGAFSWQSYSVVIVNDSNSPLLTPEAKARIHINAFTPGHTKCATDCTTNWNGCHQGCAQIPHSGAVCISGCDFEYNRCLSSCPH